MTFLHKLAKRLALIGATPAVVFSFLGSCTQGTATEYLGPDPRQPTSSSPYIGLSIHPNDPQLVLGDSIRFEARGWLSSGLSTTATATWSATGATVGSDGWFRATSLGTFRVRAAVAGLLDEVVVVVSTSGGITRLDVTPVAPALPAGTSQQFTAVALMKDGSRTTPTVSWTAEGGQIDKNGVFKADRTEGGYKVRAKVDSTVQGETAGVVDPPVLTQLNLAPSSSFLEPGEELQFTVSATWSDGSHTLPKLTFRETGGSLSPAGVYTAGNTPGDYRVIVSSAGKADTAHVSIVSGILGIRVAPLTAVLALGATQQLQAFASREDGTESQVSVQWSAQGGTVTANGTYTAGNTPGSFPIIGTLATAGGQVFRDTAHFQVGSTAATLTQLVVRSDTTILAGTTAQFSVVGTWSDGSSTVPSVTWSATGGSITANGLFTAPGIQETYRVFAKEKTSGKADTAVVRVLAEPVLTVTAFTVAPATTMLSIGQSRQFSATLSWSDGKVHPVDISWVSAGGTITQNGLYTAGKLAGTFLIVATCSCGVADTASVTIPAGTSEAVTLTQVVVSPATAQVAPGGSKQFGVSGIWSDGGTAQPAVSWVAEGGTISSTGYFAAAQVPGSYRVIATQSGGGPADTAMVTVGTVTSSASLTQLTLTPGSVALYTGGAQQFAVSGTWSDGSSLVPPVSYTATGGTITAGGMYSAGSTEGTFRVIAVHTGSTKADTSAITISTAPAGGGLAVEPELPRSQVSVSYPTLTGRSIPVGAGGNLQAAIDKAACGDELVLAAGASFTGSFVLPNKGCSATSWIVIRGAAPLPPMGTRVTPATATGFPRLLAPGSNGSPLMTGTGAGYYRLVGIEVTAPATETALNTLVRLNTPGATSLSQVPHHIILDRVYVHGHAGLGLKNCLMMNSGTTAVVDSYLSECHLKGQDSQAISSWAGPGPFLIRNNYLEGAGETILFGGADPSIQGLIPSDITIQGNHVTRPASWKGAWLIKNLFEIKNAQRVLVERNVFENNWVDGQAGFAVLIKSNSQSGNAPWSIGADVLMRHNLIASSAAGVNIAGVGPFPSVPTTRIALQENVLENIGSFNGTSGAYAWQILGPITDITISGNVALTNVTTSLMALDYVGSARLTLADNLFRLGAYGIKGSGTVAGTASLSKYWSPYTMTGNTLVGSGSGYPAGNQIVSTAPSLPGLVLTVQEYARLARLGAGH